MRVRIGVDGEWPVAGVVVGDPGPLSAAAHSWGFAEGRARGPALLRLLFTPTVRRTRFIDSERVTEWGPRTSPDPRKRRRPADARRHSRPMSESEALLAAWLLLAIVVIGLTAAIAGQRG